MKPRHQTTVSGKSTFVRDESGTVEMKTHRRQSPDVSNDQPLRNLELRQSPTGNFLIFKTKDGNSFHFNLDCQEEYGFEAKEVLQKWASEQ